MFNAQCKLQLRIAHRVYAALARRAAIELVANVFCTTAHPPLVTSFVAASRNSPGVQPTRLALNWLIDCQFHVTLQLIHRFHIFHYLFSV